MKDATTSLRNKISRWFFGSLLFLVPNRARRRYMQAVVQLVYPPLTPFRRYDGRWTVLPRNELAKLFTGDADHKRFNSNNYIPILRDLVGDGDTVLDIGASYGDEVIDLSLLVGPTGKVIAFEPDEDSFAALQATVAANALRNVECVRAFVSDNSASIDQYWHEHLNRGPVHLLKIDTDGHELTVLRGAKVMLDNNPQCKVLAEFLPRLNYEGMSGAKALSRYASNGFELHAIKTAIVPIKNLETEAEFIGDKTRGYCHDVVLTRRPRDP